MKSKYGFITTKQRSETMKKIKSKDTSPEITLRKALWAKGYRYRKNDHTVFGKPDISFKGKKVAIFVDGEFWHGYNWEEKKLKIKSNRKYWIKKIEGNMARDHLVNDTLSSQGWKVLRFWDWKIKKDLDSCLKNIEVSL